MKAQCLPFSQIPHTTRLFDDLLSYSPSVRQFYPHSPHFSEWLQEQAATLQGFDSARRESCLLYTSGSHVGENDRRAGFEMIYERVETGRGVNVHFGY